MRRLLSRLTYALEKRRRRRAIARQRARHDGRTIVHVLHIGKTGGTAIRHAFAHHDEPVCTDRVALFFHNHTTTLADVPTGEGVALVVRHPVDRFVSGFRSRQRQGRPRAVIPWTAGERRAFQRFEDPNHLAEALADGEAAAEDAMRSINHVRHPLGHWLGTPELIRQRREDLFFVGRQPNLNQDMRTLLDRMGVIEDVQLPDDDAHSHRNPTAHRESLSDRGRRAIETWYARDLDLLDALVDVGALPALPASTLA